jgi:ribonuclease J
VVNTIDQLMIQGANVVYGRDKGIHVSGHGCQEDQKLMLALTKPKFFLPVHGEHRMLIKHSETAQSVGVPAENMVIIDNGDVVELTPDAIKIGGKVPAGIELMDTAGIVQANVLQERQRLAEDGMVTVAAVIGANGEMLTAPEVHLRGVVTSVTHDKWRTWVKEAIELALRNRWEQYTTKEEDGQLDIDWEGLKTHLERELHGLLRRELQTRASLLFLMQYPQQAERAKGRVVVPSVKTAAAAVATPTMSNGTPTPTRRQRSTAKAAG